ncbi:MAG: DNA translocase FtsK 4TM domain-containing protein [Rhizobiales bacterium]|nr:DNA translocase FtsK 4TM domain-containing protein [Hyphomicrobiales bacterium]
MSDFSNHSHQNDYDNLQQGLNENTILPSSLSKFIFNRFFEIFGIITLIFVVYASISIVSWSPSDPSFNNATSDIPQNSMGLTGAYLSDFLIQTFGIAIAFMFIPIIIFGWNLVRHQIIKRPILRTIAWVVAGCFLAGALAALPIFGDWPLAAGFGGISGKVTISIVADLFGSSSHIAARSAAAILLGVLGLALGLYACGLRFKEMLATLTFLNESSIDSGANFAKKAKNSTATLGLKSLSIANYLKNLKNRNQDPFDPAKKPWKIPNDQTTLEYQNLTKKNIAQNIELNENKMKNAPEFLSNNSIKPDTRNKNYNPLKAKTGMFINKIMSGIGRKTAENQPYDESHNGQHIDPTFNPHAFEPIARETANAQAPHIPNLNQELQSHYQVEQQNHNAEPLAHNLQAQPNNQPSFNPTPIVHNEVMGSAEMGDFYDGPNSYEDYWSDAAIVAEQAIIADPHPFAPEPQMHQSQPHRADHYQAEPYMPDPYLAEPYAAEPMPRFDAPVYDDAPIYAEPAPQYNEPFAHPAAQLNARQVVQNVEVPHNHYMPQAPVAPLAPTAPLQGAPIPAPVETVIAPVEQATTPTMQQPKAANCNATNPTQNSPAPFDLSAPKVDVRKGRVVHNSPVMFKGKNYELPSIDLLAMPEENAEDSGISEKVLAANARILENVLAEFRISGEIMNVRPGPVVTLYELEPAPGVKSARVIGLADDIARSMSAISARIAVIPGRNVIGIELPNERRDIVYLNEIIAAPDFHNEKYKLPMALGKSIDGTPVIADLARMPHLLIAGTTGSGKSVGINSMILSILYKYSPDKCKLIMVDPKMLELSIYDGIPHLLTPVVTDPKKAVVALKWSVREMESRYKKMSKMGVRNIEGYNQRIKAAEDKGEPLMRTVQTGFDHETGKPVYEHEALDYKEMPFIVIVIDEMADLMMVAGKEIETAIQRLAQMARAAGIHIITATQRPSVDVITGSIKANFPTRISFQVTSKIDSRTILNEMGAEQLLGQGDMLHMAGGGRIARVHGAFVSDEEVESIVNHLKRQGVPEYIDDVTVDVEAEAEAAAEAAGNDPIATTDANGGELDLYDQAVAIVARDKKASTSYIQRKLSIGYNRAATIIERMEEEGVIGPANHAGKRDILVGDVSDF